jgi:hypothetical protein
MRTKLSAPKPNEEQLSRFLDAAKSLECDESEERFDAALRKVAAHKPGGAVKKLEAQEPRRGTRRPGQE